MTFDVKAAREAGYSDDKIADFLSKSNPNFDIQSARQSGYSDDKIVDFLSNNQQKKSPVIGLAPAQGRKINQKEPESAGRLAAQVIKGTGNASIPGQISNVSSLIGTGEAIAEGEYLEENWDRLKKLFPNANFPDQFPKEKYAEAVQQASQNAPNPETFVKILGHNLGIDTESKTELDKLLRVGSEVAGFGLEHVNPEIPQRIPNEIAEASEIIVPKRIPPSEPPAPPIAPSSPPPPAPAFEMIPELPTGSPNRAAGTQALEKLSQSQPPVLPPTTTVSGKFPGKSGGTSLVGRVTDYPELGESVSKDRFHSDAQAGREITSDVKNNFEIGKKEVKAAYKEAEGITESHNDRYPELAYKNEQRIEELERIPKRDPGAELVYQDALALRNLIGTPDGLFEANARTVMKQADSFSSRVKYDAPYQGVKSLVKSMVKDMNESVISSLRRAGKDADKVVKADQIYGRFADTFYSDEIAPFLSKDASKNAESLGNRTLSNQATYRSVKQASGSRILPVINKIDREIVDSRMGKYAQTPKFGSKEKSGSQLVGSKQYNKDLSDLSELIGKEKTSEVDYFLRAKQARDELSFLKQEKVQAAKKRDEGSKITEERVKPKKEEIPSTEKELDKIFKNPSDIRRFKKQMLDRGLKSEYEALAKEKIIQIFKEGGYEGRKLTGQQIKKVIEKEHEVLNELIGEERVSSLFKEAQVAGEKEISVERSKVIEDKIFKFVMKTAAVGAGGAVGGPLGASIAGALVGIAF